MSFEHRPRCKVCGALHFAKEPHEFGGHKPTGGTVGTLTSPTAGNQDRPVDTEPRITAGLCAPDTGAVVHHTTARGPGAENGATVSKRGRPATGFDKKAYDRQKAAERRARLKAK